MKKTSKTHTLRDARHSKVTARQAAVIRKAIHKRRPVHKKVLLHPFTIFILLCVGVLMIGWTFQTYADDILVTAKIPAAPLTQPAVITEPADGTHVTSIPITVIGTCPDGSYVTLTRNGVFSGVAFCVGNTFQIVTDLSPGANILLPQDYNITDDPGPTSSSITVYYDQLTSTTPTSPNAPTSNNKAPSNVTPASTPPLSGFYIKASYKYTVLHAGQPFSLSLGLVGGTAPYAVNILWGDGNESTLLQLSNTSFTATHVYTESGNHVITITSTDANNQQALLQLVTSTSPKTPSVIAPIKPPSFWAQWQWALWPTYGVVVLMTLSYWLGEREEHRRITIKRATAH